MAAKVEQAINQPTFAIAVQDSSGATQAVWIVMDSEHVIRLDALQTVLFTPGPKYDEFNAVPLPKRSIEQIDSIARSAKIAVQERVAPATGIKLPGGTDL